MSLDSSTVLITGGLGQIGTAIIKYLQSKHPAAIIHVLDLELPPADSPQSIANVLYHSGNVTDETTVHKVLESVKPNVVFHTAGLIPQIALRLGRDNEESYMEVNVEGTRVVLEESQKVGSVKAFVYTSSADVVKGLSWLDLDGVNEETLIPKKFDSPYPKSKAVAEILVLSASSPTFPTTCIRASGVFSAADRNIIPLFLSAPRNIRFGRGTNLYDFTYAPNLATAHCLAAANLLDVSIADSSPTSPAQAAKTAAGRPFFVTNAEPVPFKDFLSWIYAADDGEDDSDAPTAAATAKPSPKVTEIPVRVAKVMVWISDAVSKVTGKKLLPLNMKDLGDSVSARWFDNTAAKEVLGYVPEVGLRDAVRISVTDYKKSKQGAMVPGAASAA